MKHLPSSATSRGAFAQLTAQATRARVTTAIVLLASMLPASANAAPAPPHLVAVFSTACQMPLPARRQFLELLSNSYRRALQVALVSALTGNGNRTGNATVDTSVPAPTANLAFVRDAAAVLNTQMDAAFQTLSVDPNLPDTPCDLTMELLWTNTDIGTGALNAAPMAFGALFAPLIARQSADINELASVSMPTLTHFAMLDQSQVPGGLAALYAEGADLYFVNDPRLDKFWVPLYARFNGSLSKHALSVDLVMTLKPAAITSGAVPASNGDSAALDGFAYSPSVTPGKVGMVRAEFSRQWDKNGGTPATIRLKFGRRLGADPRAIITCSSDPASQMSCGHFDNESPTASMSAVGNTFTQDGAWFLSLDHFKIVVRAVAVNLETLELDAAETDLPLVTSTGKNIVDSSSDQHPFHLIQWVRTKVLGNQIELTAARQLHAQASSALQPVLSLFGETP